MDSLWSTYGLPMDSLWSTYGVPMEQHRRNTLAAPFQRADTTGASGCLGEAAWHRPAYFAPPAQMQEAPSDGVPVRELPAIHWFWLSPARASRYG